MGDFEKRDDPSFDATRINAIFDRPKPTPMQRMGRPGYTIMGGYIQTNEKDSTLAGNRRYETFANTLLNVTIVATGVRYFQDLIAGAEWSVSPADESAESERYAKLVEEILDDMDTPFERIMKRAAMYKFYGFSIAEWTMKPREDGHIGFADIEPRPQKTIDRWHVDERGVVQGVVQRVPSTGQYLYIPRGKLLYVVDDSLDDSPEGLGLFRHMAQTADSIRRFEKLEHWGFETDLRGVPVGRAPLSELQRMVDEGTLTESQAAAMKGVMSGFIQNHIRGPNTGIMLDSATFETEDEKRTPSANKKWDVELLKAQASSHAEIDGAIKRKTFELARLMGVESLLFGGDGTGSFALHKSSTQRLYQMINSALDELKASARLQLIKPLAIMNMIPDKFRPRLVPEKIEYRTVEEVVSALEGMARAGVPIMPNDPAVNEVRDLIGLSHPETVGELDMLLSMSMDANGNPIAAPGQPKALPAPGRAGAGEDDGDDEEMPDNSAKKFRQSYDDLRRVLEGV